MRLGPPTHHGVQPPPLGQTLPILQDHWLSEYDRKAAKARRWEKIGFVLAILGMLFSGLSVGIRIYLRAYPESSSNAGYPAEAPEK